MRSGRRLLFAAPVLAAALPGRAQARDPILALPDIVAKVMPTVVSVIASGITQVRTVLPGAQQTSANGMPQAPPTTTERTRSIGSGFVVDTAGIVVTNNHVIDGADSIAVTLQDGTFLQAQLLGRDVPTDLAVLKLSTSHRLVAARFGDSARARPGDAVFAIGNPFGIGSSVTSGIVSAVGRDIQEGPYDSFIQTDAPINRGNSGGPLFDLHGDVIGVNSAIYSPTGGSVGISFAIPANLARSVIEELTKQGYVKRAFLGAGVQQLTPTFAESLGLDAQDGAIVAGVDPNSPAAKAGLRNGDVILSFNNRPVKDAPGLSRSVAMTSIGSSVPLVIWRDGDEKVISVSLAEQPHQAPTQTQHVVSQVMDRMKASADLGLQIVALSDQAREARGLASGDGGVLVQSVSPDSFAAERGVRANDVIVNVEQQVVSTPEQFWQQIEAQRAQKHFWVILLVQNSSGLRWIDIPVVNPEEASN